VEFLEELSFSMMRDVGAEARFAAVVHVQIKAEEAC
jgi:hypothetical protein